MNERSKKDPIIRVVSLKSLIDITNLEIAQRNLEKENMNLENPKRKRTVTMIDDDQHNIKIYVNKEYIFKQE